MRKSISNEQPYMNTVKEFQLENRDTSRRGSLSSLNNGNDINNKRQ